VSEYIKGADELIAKLQALKKTKAKAAIRKACRAGAKTIQAAAKALAPEHTGHLEAQIKVRAIERSRVAVGARVTLQMPYGSFVELGSKHNIATHFMQKAANNTGASALTTALQAIKDEIEKTI
jgi:HK97 gp10 family phage protein